jgi:hypothetical protein
MYMVVLDKDTPFARPHDVMGFFNTPDEVADAIDERVASIGVAKKRYSIASLTFVKPVTKTVTTWEEV